MAERDKRVAYQIKVRGKLDERWSDWFSGLRVVVESESPPLTTSIGLIDQAGRRGSAQRISSPPVSAAVRMPRSKSSQASAIVRPTLTVPIP
jgi:hypothetical protein